MKVGMIVDNDFDNDPRVSQETALLVKKGYEVYVLCFGYSHKRYEDDQYEFTIDRIRINPKVKGILFAVQNRFPVYIWLWQRHIKKFVQQYQLDVVHCHDLYMSEPTKRGIRRANISPGMILDLHENFAYAIQEYTWTKSPVKRLLAQPQAWQKKEGKLLRQADFLIVLSQPFKDLLLQRYSFLEPEQIYVHPNVISFEKFDQYHIDDTIKQYPEFTLLYFGGVAERRGIFESIEALKEVLKHDPNIRLLIIGPVDKADKKRFLAAIHQAGVREHITYIPWIDLSQLPSYLHISDACLAPFHKNPQHESGVANKIFQYMYGKKAVIASNCKPQQDLIEAANGGLIFSNLEEYVQCIRSLAQDPSRARQLGLNAYRYLIAHYAKPETPQALLRLYQNLPIQQEK